MGGSFLAFFAFAFVAAPFEPLRDFAEVFAPLRPGFGEVGVVLDLELFERFTAIIESFLALPYMPVVAYFAAEDCKICASAPARSAPTAKALGLCAGLVPGGKTGFAGRASAVEFGGVGHTELFSTWLN
jgi:hypothetical protein